MNKDDWLEAQVEEEELRWQQALENADTTPRPATGKWMSYVIWTGGEEIAKDFDRMDVANQNARVLFCCNGVERVMVCGPDGTVHATCAKGTGHGYWLRHTDEARKELEDWRTECA